MKKSSIIMILLSIVFLFFVNEYYRNDEYKEVEIPNMGVLKVPEDWYCSKNEDGLLYFANMPINNDKCEVYLIQHSLIDNSSEKENISEKYGYYFENYSLGDVLSMEKIFISPYGDSNTFSNGCRYQSCSFYLNGTKVDSYYINLTNGKDSSIFFIVDDSIDIKTMENMTKWFKKYY